MNSGSTAISASSLLLPISNNSQSRQIFTPVSISVSFPRQRHASLRCRSSSNDNGSPIGVGNEESRAVLDAFFLGRAFAEALNERIGVALGEVLSNVGRWQAEQQKQVLDFQEEVVERAKRAKEQAVFEAKEEQSGVTKSVTVSPSNGTAATSSPARSTAADNPFQEMLRD